MTNTSDQIQPPTPVSLPPSGAVCGDQEARSRGYKPGRFSFNVRGGRCEACQGDGVTKVEMHFLPDIYVPCDVCKGKRYNRETLEIKFKDLNISEVLNLTVEDALSFFEAVPAIHRKLQTLMDVGLSYIRLGQAATTLSGGEAAGQAVTRALESEIPVIPSISSTSPPRVCTLRKSASCWKYCIA